MLTRRDFQIIEIESSNSSYSLKSEMLCYSLLMLFAAKLFSMILNLLLFSDVEAKETMIIPKKKTMRYTYLTNKFHYASKINKCNLKFRFLSTLTLSSNLNKGENYSLRNSRLQFTYVDKSYVNFSPEIHKKELGHLNSVYQTKSMLKNEFQVSKMSARHCIHNFDITNACSIDYRLTNVSKIYSQGYSINFGERNYQFGILNNIKCLSLNIIPLREKLPIPKKGNSALKFCKSLISTILLVLMWYYLAVFISTFDNNLGTNLVNESIILFLIVIFLQLIVFEPLIMLSQCMVMMSTGKEIYTQNKFTLIFDFFIPKPIQRVHKVILNNRVLKNL